MVDLLHTISFMHSPHVSCMDFQVPCKMKVFPASSMHGLHIFMHGFASSMHGRHISCMDLQVPCMVDMFHACTCNFMHEIFISMHDELVSCMD